MPLVHVQNFSYGLVNPVLGFLMSCLGAFIGLRCLTRARAYTGPIRALWLSLAAIAIGATGIWAMHFIAMLGFTIPGETIRYNVTLTIVSMLVAVVVVAIGLFIVGFSRSQGLAPLLTGGVIVGLGVASMHYLGMEAMEIPDMMAITSRWCCCPWSSPSPRAQPRCTPASRCAGWGPRWARRCSWAWP